MKPGKRGAIPKNAPPILDRLNLSAELWLHSFEHFGKRRAANHVTPASKINATARLPAQPMAVQKARKKDGGESRWKLCITYHFWMAPFAFAVSRDCCADG